MPVKFTELMEAFSTQDRGLDNLFAGEAGMRPASRRGERSPEYEGTLAEAVRFYADVLNGSTPLWRFQEAMSRSDFPLFFGDILDRSMLAAYNIWPMTWPNFARRATVADFRTHQRFATDGGDAALTVVEELTEYPERAVQEARYLVNVKKYGARMAFSWETMINDDLGFLERLPAALARGAARTEERLVTDVYVGPNGPDAALYTVGNGNIITGNPALSIAGLQTALTAIANMKDAYGEPIFIETVILAIPPALEVVANNILNGLQLELNENGGAANTTLITANWLRNRFRLVVNPYIPVLASTANGNTSWFLFADPGNGRPAIEVDFLRGNEQPTIFRRLPDAERVGGGTSFENGSFETDEHEYKVRHVVGATVIDPKMTVASNGTGT